MLQLTLFIAFCLSPAAFFAQTIELDVNGVNIGSSYAAIIEKLGRPSSVKKGGIVPCSDGSDRIILRYPGLVLMLETNESGENFGVYDIKVTSNKWSVSGLKIGTSKNGLLTKFGGGREVQENGNPYLAYFITDGYARFRFKHNRLTEAAWELNFC